MIDKFIAKFTEEKIPYIKIKNKYFLENKELMELSKKLNCKIEAASLYLGEENETFKPSLALLEILARTSKEKVFLNDIGEIDFIYGRKKLGKRHIKSIQGNNNRKLVQNEHDENLGYCKIIDEDKIKNVLDRGDFLRREKNQKRA
ncbi:MAG: hypothetical protein KKF52_04770 [Nanoarchaeota archaeon]|nr:hypothetical protein [Nanoarchaeota archaeon]MBU4242517.1 hypothetical protein [Nanoarchaeota archaeon]MBU4352451.1 hypothetical protein [Nanoarchaeota archaeon]